MAAKIELTNKPMAEMLAERMKKYENKYYLPQNLPVIIRIDGRAFHTLTKNMGKPYDMTFIDMMNKIAICLCERIQNCRMAYLQSDEISLLIYQEPGETAWFDNEAQKLASVTASTASAMATKFMDSLDEYTLWYSKDYIISFDSRAFVLPILDVVNYFSWRQMDWERNSLSMLATSFYSQKELNGKKAAEMHDMIHKAGGNWNNLATSLKRGRCCIKESRTEHVKNDFFEGDVERYKWVIDNEIPIFAQDLTYILSRLDNPPRGT